MSDGDVLPSPKRSKSPISAAEPSSSEKRPDVSESGSEGESGSEPVKVTKKQHEKMRSLELYAAANAASERVQKMLERMSSSNCDDADECSAPEVVEMERVRLLCRPDDVGHEHLTYEDGTSERIGAERERGGVRRCER